MSFYNLPVSGRNIEVNSMGDLIKTDLKIIIFLRHLGCNLSRKLLSDIVRYEERYNVNFPIFYVSQGSRNYNEIFWQKTHPGASVVYDPNLTIAKAFGLKEGTLVQVINPQSMFCSLKAMANGIFPSGIKGNVFMMPGIFVYLNGRTVFNHISTHAGDIPEFENLVKVFLQKTADSAN